MKSFGDEIELIARPSMKIFAKARITSVEEKQLRDFNERDTKGHEKFENAEEMYKTYSGYYNRPVTPETFAKVIKFRLIK